MRVLDQVFFCFSIYDVIMTCPIFPIWGLSGQNYESLWPEGTHYILLEGLVPLEDLLCYSHDFLVHVVAERPVEGKALVSSVEEELPGDEGCLPAVDVVGPESLAERDA